MPGQVFANMAYATLDTAVGPSDTTFVLAAGGGAVFGTLAYAEYILASFGSSEAAFETVRITGITGDTLTVERAVESTAQSWSAGAVLSCKISAATLEGLLPAPTHETAIGQSVILPGRGTSPLTEGGKTYLALDGSSATFSEVDHGALYRAAPRMFSPFFSGSQYPSPGGRVDENGGRFVAGCGYDSAPLYSDDLGATWSYGTGTAYGQYPGVHYDGSLFLTIDLSNTQFYTSADGAAWTIAASPPPYFSRYLGAANGHVFGADGDTIYFTGDAGASWGTLTVAGTPSFGNGCVVFDGTNYVFLIYENNSGSVMAVITSDLMTSTTHGPVGTGSAMVAVTYDGVGKYAALDGNANVWVSTAPGTLWTTNSADTGVGYLGDLLYHNGVLYATGSGKVSVSYDALVWDQYPVEWGTQYLLAYGPKIYYFGGSGSWGFGELGVPASLNLPLVSGGYVRTS